MAPTSRPLEHKQLGNEYFQQRKWQEAIDEYTKGLSRSALDEEELPAATRGLLLSNRSQCWLNLGDWQRAHDDSDECIKLLPEHVKSLFRRATAREHLGKDAEALADYAQVAKADPKNRDAVAAAQRLRERVMKAGSQKLDGVLPANLLKILRTEPGQDESASNGLINDKIDACRKMQGLCVHKGLTATLVSSGAVDTLIGIAASEDTPSDLQEVCFNVLVSMASGHETENDEDDAMTRRPTDNSTGPLPVSAGAAEARKQLLGRMDLPQLRRACRHRAKPTARLALIIGYVFEPENGQALEAIHDAVVFVEGGECNVPRSGILGLSTMLDRRWRLGKLGKPLMPSESLVKCLESALGTTTCETALGGLLPRVFSLLADSERPKAEQIDLPDISLKVLEPFLSSDDTVLKSNGLMALEALFAADAKVGTTVLHGNPVPLSAILNTISHPPPGPEGRTAQGHAAECILLAMGSRQTRQNLIAGGGVDMLLHALRDGQEGSQGVMRAKLVNVLAMLAGHNKDVREEVFDRLDFLMELRFALDIARDSAKATSDGGAGAADRKDKNEARRLYRGLYESCACLTIHAEFKEMLASAKNTMKSMLAVVRTDDLAEDANLAFLYASVVYNLCRSREDKVRSKSENSMINELGEDDLKALEEFYEKMPAESRPERNGEVDAGSVELADQMRAWCALQSGSAGAAQVNSKVQTSLVVSSLAKCVTSGSVRAKNLAALALKFLCATQGHRRIVATSGGIRALLNLVDLEEDLSRDAARQALAQILIVTNPTLLQYSEQLDAVRPLVQLMEHRHELLQFEGAMALTNLLSASDELRSRALQAEGWSHCRDLLFSDNELVQRAGMEALCNLTMAPDMIERFVEGKNDNDLKIILAFSMADDRQMRVASTGALAMLSNYEDIVVRVTETDNFSNLLQAIGEVSDADIEHRVATILCNVCAVARVDPGKLKATRAALSGRRAKGFASEDAKLLVQATLDEIAGA